MIPDPASFRLDAGDYHALNKLVFRRCWVPRLYWAFAVICAALLSAIFLESITLESVMPIIVGIMAGGAVLAFKRLMLRRRSLKVFAESASLRELQTISAINGGFSTEQESGTTKLRWENVAKWDETADIFAIFPNRLMAYILPKVKVRAAMIDYMRNQLIEAGLPKPGKLRK